MPQDSSSINNLLLPNDSLSHFKAFVRMQDEVPAVFSQKDTLPYQLITKEEKNILQQTSTKDFTEIDFFKQSSHHTDVKNPISRTTQSYDAIHLLIFLSLMLYALVQFFAFHRIKAVFYYLFKPKKAETFYVSSDKISISFIGVIFQLLYYFSLALFLVQVFPFFGFHNAFWKTFLVVGILIMLYKVVSFILHFIFSFIFEINSAFRLGLKNTLFMQLIIGVLLIPFNFFIAYNQHQVFVYIALILLFSLSIYSFIRKIILSKRVLSFSLFHIILYFCSVEILPLLILLKVVLVNFVE